MDDGKIVKASVALTRFRLKEPHEIPVRPWIIRNFLLRGAITEIIAPSATGKSNFALAIAAHLSAGRSYGPLKIAKPFKAAVLSVEESGDEIDRRMTCLARTFEIQRDELFNLFLVSTTGAPVLATADNKGAVRATKVADDLATLAFQGGIDVIVLDPLVELWVGLENDNTQMNQFLGQLRDMAELMNAAILLLHHTGKALVAPGELHAGRGASSNAGTVRLAFTLNAMTAEMAKALGLKPKDAVGKIRMDRAKANYLPPATETDWFQHRNIDLANGDPKKGEISDHVGVLVPWAPPGTFEGLSIIRINACLDIIDAGILDETGKATGWRYTESKAGRSNARWVGHLIAASLEVIEERAELIAKAWIESGLLYSREYKNPNSKTSNGLYVASEMRP